MILLKRLRLFSRSLRQLVLLAFLFVLFPFLILTWQAYKGLEQLSAKAAEINYTTLMDARRSEVMAGVALEMERSYRQYCVLLDPSLAQLYQNQREQYEKMLKVHIAMLPKAQHYQNLQQILVALATIKCHKNAPSKDAVDTLHKFSQASNKLLEATRITLFSRGQQLQTEIAKRGHYFGFQALALFFVSLLLIILFTRMIIAPVKTIKHMINRIGEGEKIDNDHSTFKGPWELRSLAQRIFWLSERLGWLESQRHEFLRHISHELKTPLASLCEGTELLADEVVGPLTLDQKEVVTILDNSSRHLQQLIEQLLAYNRTLLSHSADFMNTDIKSIIDTIIAAHSLSARAKHISTEVQIAAPSCWAEPTLLTRALDNLYSNAVHYGRESGNIWLYSRQVGQRVQIDVANSGTPIPETEKFMIFEPFFQGVHQRKGAVKGSGLGLSIAQDCLRRMHGKLDLVQVDYADVCLRIELPLVAENE